MDNIDIIETTDEPTLAEELAKALALSIVTTAGSMVGLLAVGFVAGKVAEIKKNRAAKKSALTEEK